MAELLRNTGLFVFMLFWYGLSMVAGFLLLAILF
jgi:hypothetical protein